LRAHVVVISGHGTVESAVEAIQAGAARFVTKPVSPEQLRSIVEEVKALFEGRARAMQLEKEMAEHFNLEGILGRSPRMLEMFDLMRRVAPHFRTVLILGETGTGKDLVARALHKMSPRRDRPFAVCNCAAVVETLFESELFGHRKGAFTGAHEDRKGLFESADGGMVFLDEVGELSLGVQSKLLRVIQNQEIQRIGSTQPLRVDVLLIAATSRDLADDVKKGRFRSDLLYRLNMIEIKVPPLRERPEDIPLLWRHFLDKYNQHYGKEVRGLSQHAQDMLMNYRWPGNVRELENVMGRACMLAQASFLDLRDFSVISARIVKNAGAAPTSLEEAERLALVSALDEFPNKTHAAKVLGVSRPKLYRLMVKHGLEVKK
jgi:DNA-binding NtrC family response regulator